MANTTVEGFSLTHAAILGADGQLAETDGEDWGDIYGVRQASIAVTSDSYDNTGDDTVLSSWFWFNYGEVTVQAGYVPFTTIANLSGETLISSGTGDGVVYELPVWTETSANTPSRPMLIRVPSKDSDGIVRSLDIILYKVQFNPFTFDGPQYKSGLLLNYSGRALTSGTNEKGQTLVKRSIGRLVSRPSALASDPVISLSAGVA
jgi:hypothetical protein